MTEEATTTENIAVNIEPNINYRQRELKEAMTSMEKTKWIEAMKEAYEPWQGYSQGQVAT